MTADFGNGFWSYLCRFHGKDYPYVSPSGWYEWSPWTPEELSAAWDAFGNEHNFWLTLKEYTENANAIREVLDSDNPPDIYYITSRTPSGGDSVLHQTNSWLDSGDLLRLGASAIVVANPSDKSKVVKALGLDAVIDDKLDTVVQGKPIGAWWLLDRTWNQAERPFGLQVVGSLKEWFEKLKDKNVI